MEEEEWKAVCYSTVSQTIQDVKGGQGLGRNLWEQIQVIDSAYEALEHTDPMEVVPNFTEVITSITPEKMAEMQHQDNQISPALGFVKEDKIPSKNNIYKVHSRNTCKLFYQFDGLILKKGSITQTLHPRGYRVPSAK